MAHDILIVDDEDDIRLLIAGTLHDEGYVAREAATSDEALEAIRRRLPNLVILDIWLQDSALDGIEILDILSRDYPGLPVVMISGHGNIETAVASIKKGAYDFIEKPFKAGKLLVIIERAIEAARLKRDYEALKRRAGGEATIIGETPSMCQMRQAIERVARTSSRVFITGPAGSGKEMVARMVHELSPRAQGPFVVLNCATMHPDRLEIELFGAEPASGEDGPYKIGTFEQAHGGTLLLDEVADMPIETQGKIVRVLQDQSFVRVGGTKKVEVDVRVVATTNRDLQAAMSAARFREDLYYRLNVVPIEVPPLRARRPDIPALAKHLMERAAAVAGVPPRRIGDDAMASLQSYAWPGNVRQLGNVIDRLLIMAEGDPSQAVSAEMLPPELRAETPMSAHWDRGGEIMTLPLREAREIFEREYLAAQVLRHDGNISKTAEFVGMERSALHRKLKSLGVPGPDKPH